MIEIKEHVLLAPMTTFRIGGEALEYCEVTSNEEVREAIELSRKKQIPVFVLGGGSNVLISDKGFYGLVIKMKLQEVVINENTIEAGAGAPLIKVLNAAAQAGLSGMEKLAGIPGTIGGAVRGNAGAFGSAIGDLVQSVTVIDMQTGEEKVFEKTECDFSYRSSFFKKNPNYIITMVGIKLTEADSQGIAQAARETIEKRIANGLSGEKSAGSYFMNPIVSDESLRNKFAEEKGVESKDDKLPAGWLIEKLDLGGKKIGGAMVSERHANYIINTGNATAEDVIMLESYVKQQVRDALGVQLQAEVSYVGF